MDAQEAAWNLRVISRTQPSEKFVGITNSDLAFTGNVRHPGQLQRLPGLGHLQSERSRR